MDFKIIFALRQLFNYLLILKSYNLSYFFLPEMKFCSLETQFVKVMASPHSCSQNSPVTLALPLYCTCLVPTHVPKSFTESIMCICWYNGDNAAIDLGYLNFHLSYHQSHRLFIPYFFSPKEVAHSVSTAYWAPAIYLRETGRDLTVHSHSAHNGQNWTRPKSGAPFGSHPGIQGPKYLCYQALPPRHI